MSSAPARRIAAASLGKLPTTSVRRPISRLTCSSGLVRAQLAPVGGGEGGEGQQVLLGVLEQPGDLRRHRLEALDDLGDALARLLAAFGVEHLSQGGGDQAVLGGPAVLMHRPDEVHTAALPRARQDAGDRGLQALVMI